MEDGGGYGNDDVLGLHGPTEARTEDRPTEKKIKNASMRRGSRCAVARSPHFLLLLAGTHFPQLYSKRCSSTATMV